MPHGHRDQGKNKKKGKGRGNPQSYLCKNYHISVNAANFGIIKLINTPGYIPSLHHGKSKESLNY